MVFKIHKTNVVRYFSCFLPFLFILKGLIFNFLLFSAENELGVVIAKSESGSSMIPVSWTEMQCPHTYAKEARKVAKVIPEHLAINPGA